VRSFLSTYSKGETPSEFSAEIKLHLDNCSSCQREVEVYQSVNKLVKGLPELKTSDEFTSRLFHRISREGNVEMKTKAYYPGRVPLFRFARLAAVGAVAIIVLSFGLSVNLVDNIFDTSSPQMALTDSMIDNNAEDLYITVQPIDNPLLSEHKSVSQRIQQYNRWRQFSKTVRNNSGLENFRNGSATVSLASAGSGSNIRVRPVVRNYLIVPGNSTTQDWKTGY
jgi:hypothetical protein